MSTWNLLQEHTRSVITGRTDTPHAAVRLWNCPCEQLASPPFLGGEVDGRLWGHRRLVGNADVVAGRRMAEQYG
jgi:hypothetical protein